MNSLQTAVCELNPKCFRIILTKLFTQCQYQWLQDYIFAYPGFLWPRNILVHVLFWRLLINFEVHSIAPADRVGSWCFIGRFVDGRSTNEAMNGIWRWCWCRNSTKWMSKVEHTNWSRTLKSGQQNVVDVRTFLSLQYCQNLNTNRKYAPINATDCTWSRCVAFIAIASVAVTYFHCVLKFSFSRLISNAWRRKNSSLDLLFSTTYYNWIDEIFLQNRINCQIGWMQ